MNKKEKKNNDKAILRTFWASILSMVLVGFFSQLSVSTFIIGVFLSLGICYIQFLVLNFLDKKTNVFKS